MFMDKIFFFDIDGTLAFHGKIPQSNIEALQALKDNGYKTYICTGRAVYYAKRLFGDLVTGYIACNGRYIEENDQKLYAKAFTKEELEEYLHRFDTLDIGCFFVSDDGAYYRHISDKVYQDLLRDYGEDHLHPYQGENANLYTFDLFFLADRFEELQEALKDCLILNNHYNGSCDCTTISFDKGNAIHYLLDYYNIDKENSYAFGDGANDVYMFREAGNKIAMGNAIEPLKQQATYVTDDYDQEGIKKALIYYKII